MANSLNRELRVGDKIVMDNDGDGVDVVVDVLMNGAHRYTSGTALGVKHPTTGSLKVDATEIDVKRTMERFAEANGWTAKAAN